jgi:hypothetical protein
MSKWYQTGVCVAAVVAGCSSGPERVKPPNIDPQSAASRAIELYDTNHDLKLNQEELAQCPGVLISIDRYDVNKDKMIDEEEFRTRLANLLKNKTGATQLACIVSYQGKPLPGANVVLEPEPYLGDEIQAANGVTTNAGMADDCKTP